MWSSGPALGAGFSGPARGQVERVIDGDTVKMRVAIWLDQEILVSVRLADVDAPELFRPKCEAERALAREGEAIRRNISQWRRGGAGGYQAGQICRPGGRQN